MHEKEAEKLAMPIVKEVVNCIAGRRYGDIERYAGFEGVTPELLREEIEGFLELNGLSSIDPFGVPCSFHPQYEYHQLSCILYRDGSGFHMDYDLTTGGELNDLTLQMSFTFSGPNELTAKILDAHVM